MLRKKRPKSKMLRKNRPKSKQVKKKRPKSKHVKKKRQNQNMLRKNGQKGIWSPLRQVEKCFPFSKVFGEDFWRDYFHGVLHFCKKKAGELLNRRPNTQQSDIWPNDTQYNNKQCGIQHNDIPKCQYADFHLF
jgi:hypothetical protein